MLCKGWRVKYNEVIGLCHLLKILKSVFGESLVTRVGWEVKFDVLINKIYCLLTAVNGVYKTCPASHRIYAKPTSIAEHIKYVTAFRVLLHQTTVISLVYKESCLLAFKPVDMEFKSIFYSNIV